MDIRDKSANSLLNYFRKGLCDCLAIYFAYIAKVLNSSKNKKYITKMKMNKNYII